MTESENAVLVLFLLLVLAIAAVLAANTAYERTSYYKNKIGQTDKFRKMPHNLKAVNMGSAHAREAFRYEGTGVTGFNFALQSQTLSYDYTLLKHYAKHLAPGCRVFIPIVPLLFCPTHYSGINNRMYYHFLPKECIIQYSTLTNAVESLAPGLSSLTAIRAVLQGSRVPQSPSMDLMQREEEALKMINCWKGNFHLNDVTDGSQAIPLQNQMEYNRKKLQDIVNFCHSKSFVPVIVILPVTDIMASKFSRSFLQSFIYDNLACVSDQTHVFDYFEDKRFAQQYELFQDSEYLNEQGADLFTRTLLEETEHLATGTAECVRR